MDEFLAGMDEANRQERLDLCRKLEEKVSSNQRFFIFGLAISWCDHIAIHLQEALQQLEANLQQQLQLICTTTRSPSLPMPTSISGSMLPNLTEDQTQRASASGASILNQSEPANVNSNDDEWELVPLQMQWGGLLEIRQSTEMIDRWKWEIIIYSPNIGQYACRQSIHLISSHC